MNTNEDDTIEATDDDKHVEVKTEDNENDDHEHTRIEMKADEETPGLEKTALSKIVNENDDKIDATDSYKHGCSVKLLVKARGISNKCQ